MAARSTDDLPGFAAYVPVMVPDDLSFHPFAPCRVFSQLSRWRLSQRSDARDGAHRAFFEQQELT